MVIGQTLLALIAPVVLMAAPVRAQHSAIGNPPTTAQESALISERVAILVVPILDEQSRLRSEGSTDDRSLNTLLFKLTKAMGKAADEALAVLMCFDIGESQEETDAVISRGREMLPYLKKYENRAPKIAGRSYNASMLKDPASKGETFVGAIKAIENGWHSTADNPEGE